MVTDLVKVGAARLRQNSATTYMVTQSMAPPAEHITTPARLPPPAGLPQTTLTKTSPERPGAKR